MAFQVGAGNLKLEQENMADIVCGQDYGYHDLFTGWTCPRLARCPSWWTLVPMRLTSRRNARITEWNTYICRIWDKSHWLKYIFTKYTFPSFKTQSMTKTKQEPHFHFRKKIKAPKGALERSPCEHVFRMPSLVWSLMPSSSCQGGSLNNSPPVKWIWIPF